MHLNQGLERPGHPSGLWLRAAACPARAQANQVTGRSKLKQGGPKVMSQRFELIASDPQNFSGVCRDTHWFTEYLKIIEIDDHFLNERSFFAFFTPLTCLDHIPFGLLLVGPSRYKYTVKNVPYSKYKEQ